MIDRDAAHKTQPANKVSTKYLQRYMFDSTDVQADYQLNNLEKSYYVCTRNFAYIKN